jgi:hypothetical protein
MPLPKTRYQELCQALTEAKDRFAGYRSECVLFAATFARGLVEYLGGPRDLVAYVPKGEPGAGPIDVEDALHLGEDTYWHLGLRLKLVQGKASDTLNLEIRFKKLESRYVVNLFGHEDFELAELTTDAIRPVYEELFSSIKRHYDDGLRLFLDKRGQNLHLPFTAQRLTLITQG